MLRRSPIHHNMRSKFEQWVGDQHITNVTNVRYVGPVIVTNGHYQSVRNPEHIAYYLSMHRLQDYSGELQIEHERHEDTVSILLFDIARCSQPSWVMGTLVVKNNHG